MPTLTATVQSTADDGTPVARVLLTLVWSGIQTALFERLDPDGEWRTVRGPDGDQVVCLDTCAIFDHEAPLDVAVTYRATSPQGSGAVNANIYFESGISSWIGANGGTIASSGTQHHQGSLALRLTPDGTTVGTNAQSEEIAVTVGATYSGAAWVRATAASSWGVGIAWYSSSHTFVSGSLVTTALAAGTWTYLTGSGAAPAGAAYGRLLVQASGTPAASNLIYVDEAVFVSPAALTVTSSAVTVPSGGKAWLSHPGHPRFAAATIANDLQRTYPGRAGMFWPIGSALPVAVTDVRGGGQGTVTWQVATLAEYQRIRAMIADGGVLLMRLPPTWGGDSWYLQVNDVTEIMPTGIITDGMRRYQMTYTRAAQPGGSADGALGVTCDDVTATYATCDDLVAAKTTCVALETSVA